MSVYTSLFAWFVTTLRTLFQSTSRTRYADIHVQDLPLGVPNGVPKHVYFVYFWVSVWYTLLNILWDGLEIPYHVYNVELDSPSRPCPGPSSGI